MRRILIYLIGKYQEYISPLLQRGGVRCIYGTSCSSYAVEALQTHSLPRALFSSVYRVASCNPLTEALEMRRHRRLTLLAAAGDVGVEEKVKELEAEIAKLKLVAGDANMRPQNLIIAHKTSGGTWCCLSIVCAVLLFLFLGVAFQ